MQHLKREIVSGDDLENAIKRGVNQLADTVKVTMGPKGRLVLIQKPGANPIVTKDGVTVASLVNLVDEVENLGAQVIKQSASRTADEAGDGTTTATVLAQSIYTEGCKMKAAGYDNELIKQGLQKGLSIALESLTSQKRDVKNDVDLKQVALISANGEEDVAELIVSAINASGIDGEVIVEEAKGFKSSLTVVDGYQVERGFLSPYFITDKDKSICEFKDPLILMCDRNYNSIHDLMGPLEIALDSNKPILVIANDIDGDALQGLVLNKVKGSLRVCAIKSPGFGATRHELLGDLQTLVGGKIINSSSDMSEFNIDDFGTCKRVIIQKASALFICDDSQTKNAEKRIAVVKETLESPSLSKQERELYKYRLRQLSGAIAVLRVGAATEAELVERYDRVDDALNATKAAIQEGILPGGGVALVRASEEVKKACAEEQDHSVKAGLEIVVRSCQSPFNQIIINGGGSPKSLLTRVLENDKNVGFDFRTNEFGDMFDLGIVDPFKVTRCALENAISAGSILLSVGCSLIEKKEKSEVV